MFTSNCWYRWVSARKTYCTNALTRRYVIWLCPLVRNIMTTVMDSIRLLKLAKWEYDRLLSFYHSVWFIQGTVISNWLKLIRPACSLHCSVRRFHDILLMHCWVISQELIGTATDVFCCIYWISDSSTTNNFLLATGIHPCNSHD